MIRLEGVFSEIARDAWERESSSINTSSFFVHIESSGLCRLSYKDVVHTCTMALWKLAYRRSMTQCFEPQAMHILVVFGKLGPLQVMAAVEKTGEITNCGPRCHFSR